MDNIIVTILDEERKLEVDLEVPLNTIAERITADVVEILKLTQPGVLYDGCRYQLLHQRSGELVKGAITIEDFGIWNGDILILMRI